MLKEFYVTTRVKFKKGHNSGNRGPDHKDEWGPVVLLGFMHPVPVKSPGFTAYTTYLHNI